MKEGDVTLSPIPQSDGQNKLRPAVVLRSMPPFGDWLVCGVTTQLQHEVPGFDEVIQRADRDFSASGLKAASLIRLGYLTVVTRSSQLGIIGAISRERHHRLLQRLCDHLRP